MDVFSLSLLLKEEGAATVKAAVDKLNRSFDEGTKKSKAYDLTIGSLQDQMQNLVGGLALAGVIAKIGQETAGAEFAAAQLNAALKSTEGVAGQSAEALNRHAQALSYVSKFDDDAITGAQALLLTFTKIQGDTFPKATQAILDMATAMGTDLKSATIQVGKALNDPILGVTALSRAGVQFTDVQKEMIAQLVESGKQTEAQTVILKELETQFAGSAEAAANTFGGAIARLNNELGNLITLSSTNSNVAVTFIDLMTDSLIGLNKVLGDVGSGVLSLGDKIGGLVGTLGRFAAQSNILVLLAAMGRSTREAATAAGDATKTAMPPVSELAGAFQGLKMRQVEIDQLLKLAEVKTLNSEQTRILRDEAARLTKEMNRQGLSMQGQYEIGKKLLEVQKALAPKGEKAKPIKFQELGLGTAAAGAFPGRLPLMETLLQGAEEIVIPPEVQTALRKIPRQFEPEFMAGWQEMTERMKQTMGNTLVDSLSAAFENLTSVGGSLKSAFKTLTANLLSGLGSMLIEFGRYAVATSTLMAKLYKLIPTNPIAAVGVGLAMIALGASIRGAASRIFTPSGGEKAPSMSMGSFTGGGNMTMPGLFYGPTAAGSAQTIQQMPNMNVTIIGPNDPSAQRQMQELMRNANRRGNA